MTLGATLTVANSGFTLGEAVGAFLATGVLLVLTRLIKRLTQLISRIPASVASAMVAAIIVTFTINAVKTILGDPWLILPLIASLLQIRPYN